MTGIINIYQNNTWVKSAGGMRICSDLEDERKHLLNQMFPTLKKCGCGTAGSRTAWPILSQSLTVTARSPGWHGFAAKTPVMRR